MSFIIDFLGEVLIAIFGKKNIKPSMVSVILILLGLICYFVFGLFGSQTQNKKVVEFFCDSIINGEQVSELSNQNLHRIESTGRDKNGSYQASTFYNGSYACDVYTREGKVFAKSVRATR